MSISRRTALLATAATVAVPALNVGGAKAAAPKVGRQVPGFYRFNIGEFEITALNDGQANFEVGPARFPNAAAADVVKVLDSQFAPSKPGISPFNTLIVNTGPKLVLIDAGFNNNGPATVGQMATNMAAAGIDPKQIDTVLISHFHPDHINGLRTKEGALVYPNAEIIVPTRDMAHYLDEAKMSAAPDAFKPHFAAARRVFAPIAKDVKQAEWGKEWVGGIVAIQSDGHSPGHTSFAVSSGSKTLLVVGDAVNDPRIFARQPDWHFFADFDRAQAVATRRRIFDMAAADKLQVSFYHAAFPATGFIAKNGTAYDWFPAPFSSVL